MRSTFVRFTRSNVLSVADCACAVPMNAAGTRAAEAGEEAAA